MRTLLALTFALVALCPSAQAYDLKGKATEFAASLRKQLDDTEDKLTRDSRAFLDELKRQWRDAESGIEKKVADADDWKKAKQAASREKRDLTRDFRQRAKVHGEELELEISRFTQEREKEANALFAEMQKEVDEFKKSKNYAEAKRDLSEAKRSITEMIRKWRSKLRELRTRNLKFE
jgi:hypothetical protein